MSDAGALICEYRQDCVWLDDKQIVRPLPDLPGMR